MPKWEDYLAAVKTAPDNALFEEPAPNLSPSVRTSARSADFEYNSELGVSDGLYFNSTCVPGGLCAEFAFSLKKSANARPDPCHKKLSRSEERRLHSGRCPLPVMAGGMPFSPGWSWKRPRKQEAGKVVGWKAKKRAKSTTVVFVPDRSQPVINRPGSVCRRQRPFD